MSRKTVAELILDAKSGIDNRTPEQVRAELAAGGVTLLDVREAAELAGGRIAGSLHVPRGMLEFYADPSSPAHKPELNPKSRVIVYCAAGPRSILAGATLRVLGYSNVANLEGGFKAWREAALPIER